MQSPLISRKSPAVQIPAVQAAPHHLVSFFIQLFCGLSINQCIHLAGELNDVYCIPPPLVTATRFDRNSSRHLSQLLETVGLSHYSGKFKRISNVNFDLFLTLAFFLCFSELFLQNEVDLAMFTTLKDDDLISIGIRSFGARKILLNAIQGILFKFTLPFILSTSADLFIFAELRH